MESFTKNLLNTVRSIEDPQELRQDIRYSCTIDYPDWGLTTAHVEQLLKILSSLEQLSVDRLMMLARSRNPLISACALDMLCVRGAKDKLPDIIDILEGSEGGGFVQVYCITALAKLGADTYADKIASYLDYQQRTARITAASLLVSLKVTKAFPNVLRVVNEDISSYAFYDVIHRNILWAIATMDSGVIYSGWTTFSTTTKTRILEYLGEADEESLEQHMSTGDIWRADGLFIGLACRDYEDEEVRQAGLSVRAARKVSLLKRIRRVFGIEGNKEKRVGLLGPHDREVRKYHNSVATFAEERSARRIQLEPMKKFQPCSCTVSQQYRDAMNPWCRVSGDSWDFDMAAEYFCDYSESESIYPQTDNIVVKVRTTDNKGEGWELRYYLSSERIMDIAYSPWPGVRREFVDQCPKAWLDAFLETALIYGIRLDTDFWSKLQVRVSNTDFVKTIYKYGTECYHIALLPETEENELCLLVMSPSFITAVPLLSVFFSDRFVPGSELYVDDSEDSTWKYFPDITKIEKPTSSQDFEITKYPQELVSSNSIVLKYLLSKEESNKYSTGPLRFIDGLWDFEFCCNQNSEDHLVDRFWEFAIRTADTRGDCWEISYQVDRLFCRYLTFVDRHIVDRQWCCQCEYDWRTSFDMLPLRYIEDTNLISFVAQGTPIRFTTVVSGEEMEVDIGGIHVLYSRVALLKDTESNLADLLIYTGAVANRIGDDLPPFVVRLPLMQLLFGEFEVDGFLDREQEQIKYYRSEMGVQEEKKSSTRKKDVYRVSLKALNKKGEPQPLTIDTDRITGSVIRAF